MLWLHHESLGSWRHPNTVSDLSLCHYLLVLFKIREFVLSTKHHQQRWELEVCNLRKCFPHHIEQSSADTSAPTTPSPKKVSKHGLHTRGFARHARLWLPECSPPSCSPGCRSQCQQVTVTSASSTGPITSSSRVFTRTHLRHLPFPNTTLAVSHPIDKLDDPWQFPGKLTFGSLGQFLPKFIGDAGKLLCYTWPVRGAERDKVNSGLDCDQVTILKKETHKKNCCRSYVKILLKDIFLLVCMSLPFACQQQLCCISE